MIALTQINQAILDRLKADTGSGGLYNGGAWNLVSGAWAVCAPANATFPYIVWTLAWTPAPSRQSDEYDLVASISVFDDASLYVDDSNFSNRVSPIMDRIHGDAIITAGSVPTYGFQRHPLVIGSNIYSAKGSTCLLTDGACQMTDEKIIIATTNMKFRVTALNPSP